MNLLEQDKAHSLWSTSLFLRRQMTLLQKTISPLNLLGIAKVRFESIALLAENSIISISSIKVLQKASVSWRSKYFDIWNGSRPNSYNPQIKSGMQKKSPKVHFLLHDHITTHSMIPAEARPNNSAPAEVTQSCAVKLALSTFWKSFHQTPFCKKFLISLCFLLESL